MFSSVEQMYAQHGLVVLTLGVSHRHHRASMSWPKRSSVETGARPELRASAPVGLTVVIDIRKSASSCSHPASCRAGTKSPGCHLPPALGVTESMYAIQGMSLALPGVVLQGRRAGTVDRQVQRVPAVLTTSQAVPPSPSRSSHRSSSSCRVAADRRVAVDGVDRHGVRYLLRCAHLRSRCWRPRRSPPSARGPARSRRPPCGRST